MKGGNFIGIGGYIILISSDICLVGRDVSFISSNIVFVSCNICSICCNRSFKFCKPCVVFSKFASMKIAVSNKTSIRISNCFVCSIDFIKPSVNIIYACLKGSNFIGISGYIIFISSDIRLVGCDVIFISGNIVFIGCNICSICCNSSFKFCNPCIVLSKFGSVKITISNNSGE